jgi:glycosyltransferase involved in cell wall biosynthesis
MEGAIMRLAVFSGQYFWFDGKDYSTDEAFVKFVMSFHPYFDKVVFCDCVKKQRKRESYVLDSTKAEVCALPSFNVYSFWKNVLIVYPKTYRIIRSNMHQWDIAWLAAPHPVSLIFAHVCRRKGKPFFFVVRQNLLEQVRHRNKGIKRFCAMAVVTVLEYICRRIAAKNLTFTVGQEMYRSYKKKGREVHRIAVSLISEKDVEGTLADKNLEIHKPLRLLSVGRLDPEKGLDVLIKAVEMMVKAKQIEVVVQIVGRGLKDGEARRLYREVQHRHLTEYVHFVGYVPHGSDLFQLYRNSDVFVLPSLTGEGFPQTLFEAMGCGVPIVASRVAGIPYLIKDGESGLLVNSGSPTEICAAVQRISGDAELRSRLVTNGLSTVKNHTLRAERDRMVVQIQALLNPDNNVWSKAE